MTTRHSLLPARARPRQWSRRSWFTQLLALGAGAVTGVARAQQPGDEQSTISVAENWLFLADHFGSLKMPARLRYRLHTEGVLLATEDLELGLEVSRRGARSAATLQLPRGPVPLAIEGRLSANPVVTWFLDRDVATMERLTGGQRRHFQRRIRFALAETDSLESAFAHFDGREVPVRRVSLQPYLVDTQRHRFPKLAAKRYVFTLSAQIPGQVLAMQTIVPGPEGDFQRPAQVETLSFVGLA